jgi:hypothetical protein
MKRSGGRGGSNDSEVAAKALEVTEKFCRAASGRSRSGEDERH